MFLLFLIARGTANKYFFQKKMAIALGIFGSAVVISHVYFIILIAGFKPFDNMSYLDFSAADSTLRNSMLISELMSLSNVMVIIIKYYYMYFKYGKSYSIIKPPSESDKEILILNMKLKYEGLGFRKRRQRSDSEK